MKSLDTIINKLKESPLFYLFLSSRELFHSNFWFWLSTINKEATFKLFTSKPTPYDILFKREHNQSFGDIKSKVDLLLSDTTRPLVVIENKVKDFPKKEQLQRIQNSFSKLDVEFVLTTLFWSEDIHFEGWNVKTYKEISDAIEPIEFTQNPYFISLIEDYKLLTLNLSELAKALKVNKTYDFAISWNWELYLKLNEIKLWEGYQKLRASHLLNLFKPEVEDVSVFYSINNQKATIDFFLQLNNDYTIGIQIEDIQFRKFVAGKKADQFADKLLEEDLFFESSFRGRGNKPYLNYGNVFKYQYTKIDTSKSFDWIFNQVNNELKSIIENRDSLINCLPNN
ncbi:hypothetical protein [Rufibacter immobilis]|uniref:hypothetical protein n=1 Tax=Rufibacter immobilis TaxID=1348778 RepID=UPI0035EC4B4B